MEFPSLYVNNGNWHPILHRFHDTTDCWSTFSLRTGGTELRNMAKI